MRKLSLLTILCTIVLLVNAQKKAPKWLDKQQKAVVSITTYGDNNEVLREGTGFFVTESGEVLSSYAIFEGAAKAIVKDSEGKQYPVANILGADDLYDVIRVKATVPRKVPFFKIASEPVQSGSPVYLIPFGQGKNNFSQGEITEVSNLKALYGYYKTSIPVEPAQLNAPMVTESGEVLGLTQDDAAGNKQISYAVSAGYIQSLAISSTDALNKTYSNIGILKAWPADFDQAQVALYLMATLQPPKTYIETLNNFIETFPNKADGYIDRASHYAFNRAELAASPDEEEALLTRAFDDLNTASKYSDNQALVNYNKAKLIYGVATGEVPPTDEAWSYKAALETIQMAIDEDNRPEYHQLKGDIYFSQEQFQQAYDEYMIVNNGEMATPSTYYMAAKSKQFIPGTPIVEMIALMDSAIAKAGSEPTQETMNYILERIDYKMQLNQYEEAIADYNLYYELLDGNVGDAFYYYRKQPKFRNGDMEGALEDMKKAITLNPNNPTYYAEIASVYIRLEDYDNAMVGVERALRLAPDFASGYRLKGLCEIRQDKSVEACESFAKAKELGDPLADRLLKEHCK